MDRHDAAVAARVTRRSVLLGSVGALTLAAWPAAAWQPDRPIEIIVGTNPGSGFDRTARLLQKIWQSNHLVDKPVTVVNRPGGFGALGWGYMNLHRGSGSYVAITSPLLLTNNITGNMALSFRDVTPLGLLEDEQIVLAVGAGSAITTGTDFMNRLRADPKSVSIAVSGIGGQNHLAVVLAAEAMGGIDVTKLRVIGFAGSGDVTTAVIGGHVDSTASPISTVAPQVAAGRMRAIAVSSSRRVGGELAATPTWEEQHVDSVFSNWRGLVGPRDMTEDQIAYWNDVLARTVKTDEWRQEVERQQLTDHYLDSADMALFLAAQNTALAEIMTKLGLAKL